jgi:hypothetical protein
MGREAAPRIPVETRRDLTGPLYLVNFFGAIIGAVYIGLMLREGAESVLFALLAVFVFIFGLIAPFMAEYLNVSQGFMKVARTFKDRHIDPDKDVEIASDSLDADPTWGRYYKINIGAFLGAVVGIGLFGWDLAVNFLL